MRFTRVFAREGFEVPTKVVDSQIRDADGSVVREVAGVRVPASWSQTAADMLAQKYLRREGVPDKVEAVPEEGVPPWLWRRVPAPDASLGSETDAQQAFRRMAGAWTYQAWKMGYFGHTQPDGTPSPLWEDEEDARAFHDEIVAMLGGQVAAPNSPQWFNTGLFWAYGVRGEPQGHHVFDREGNVAPAADAYSRPAASACFIQSVGDHLLGPGGILDLVEREARVFKFGGGSGTNFSRLRAKGEPLSGGGSSSGLLSWLKINDRSASAIKSGGTTRRAARMVVVDVDHPDIEEFVGWKVGEEHKVACMAAGSLTVRRHLERVARCAATLSRAARPSANGSAVGLDRDLALARQEAWQAGVHPLVIDRVATMARSPSGGPQATSAATPATSAATPATSAATPAGGAALGGDDPERVVRQVLAGLPTYTVEWEGEAYGTVSGQNANNTVRVPDAFLRAATSGGTWDLTWRTDARVARTVVAGDLWGKIVDAAWSCADPGLHFATTVNDWNTCPADGEIDASNPCGEYIYLPDTACNLASLNLLKFLVWEGGRPRLDTQTLRHAARVWQVVLDVTVDLAGYPSPEIALGSWKYRTTGLGYCNVGALLMAFGLPYDSPQGRAVAAAAGCVVHCQAYDTSAELAAWLSPFPRFQANRAACLRVLRNHAAAVLGEPYEGLSTPPPRLEWPDGLHEHDYLCRAAREAAQDMLVGAEEHGVRNAQVTVVAPTGTIGLLMDADTTGIEPDFALVKHKKLAGGGWLKLVNQTVKSALAVLGYSARQVEEVCRHVAGRGSLAACVMAGRPARDVLAERGVPEGDLDRLAAAAAGCVDVRHVLPDLDQALAPAELDELNLQLAGAGNLERAPHVRPEHLPVFDCASRLGGGARCIRPEAHVLMLAAVQPFVSGSISKTVNAPREWDRDQVGQLFLLAWSKACKDVAVYRDGCKLSQVLHAVGVPPATPKRLAEVGAEPGDVTAPAGAAGEQALAVERALALMASGQGARRRALPDRRLGYTQKARIGRHKVYLRTGEYPDGTLGEIFVDMHKEGTPFRSLMNHFAIAVSIGLQHGVPLEEFVDAFSFTRFDPCGPVKGNAQVKFCTSLTDYLVRELAVTYLGRHDLGHAEPPADMDALEPVPQVPEKGPEKGPGTAPGRPPRSREGVGPAKLPGPRQEARERAHQARLQGYEGDPCGECGMFTLVRTGGRCTRCDSCGAASGCS